jgi:hypothetical protein
MENSPNKKPFTKEEIEAITTLAFKMCSAPMKEYLLLALNEAEAFFKNEDNHKLLEMGQEEIQEKINACKAAKEIVGPMEVAEYTGRQEFGFKEHKYKLVMILAALPLDYVLEIKVLNKYNLQVFKHMDHLADLARAYYGELLKSYPELKNNIMKVFGPRADSLNINENNRMMYFVLQQKIRLGINCYYIDETGKILDEITDEMLTPGR